MIKSKIQNPKCLEKHVKRLEEKRKRDQNLKEEQEKKPGSGKIWRNKITKPAAPKITNKTARKKHRKADYLAPNPHQQK